MKRAAFAQKQKFRFLRPQLGKRVAIQGSTEFSGEGKNKKAWEAGAVPGRWAGRKASMLHVVWDKVGSRGWDAMAGSRGVPTRDLERGMGTVAQTWPLFLGAK